MPVDRIPADIDTIAPPLLAWYAANARLLPWRMPPGSLARPDPYPVWLAEVMLQQTTVAAAAPRYSRFLARFPDVAALAAAPVDDVMAEWAGLGYYARARNLHACAQAVVALGGFPDTEPALRALPGLGDYTAAAVAAIAFGRATVPMDANLLRVGARLFACALPPAAARPTVRAALTRHLPADASGDFAQALMDLGSAICTPRAPRCLLCPLQTRCAGRATPDAFPAPVPRKARPTRQGTLWWLEHGGSVALIRRPPKGLLGGLLALPGTPWLVDGAMDATPPFGRACLLDLVITHGFTHFELRLGVVAAQLPSPIAMMGDLPVVWTPRDRLADAGLPTLYRKAAAAVLALKAPSCFEAA